MYMPSVQALDLPHKGPYTYIIVDQTVWRPGARCRSNRRHATQSRNPPRPLLTLWHQAGERCCAWHVLGTCWGLTSPTPPPALSLAERQHNRSPLKCSVVPESCLPTPIQRFLSAFLRARFEPPDPVDKIAHLRVVTVAAPDAGERGDGRIKNERES